ncbi:MAG: hypothetical protein ACK4NR_03330 [Micavibrio sp.]
MTEPSTLQPSQTVRNLAASIGSIFKDNPEALTSFEGQDKLNGILKEIEDLDHDFEQKGGIYFRAGEDPFETAKEFTRIHVEQYRQGGRPSLPALAFHHAEGLGVPAESPAYKALLLVSTRAEMKLAIEPDYHSKCHYADVTAFTANLLNKNNQLVAQGDRQAVNLSVQEQALTLIAAIGHDLDHEGKGNPPEQPLLNEEASFAKMLPLLQAAGLEQDDIEKIHVILQTTSPNGPHAVLKEAAKAHREGREPDWVKADKDDRFTGLRAALEADTRITQMASMVSDADLAASSISMESSQVMSALLTNEFKKSGGNIDFTTDAARKFFLDNIVGTEGYASAAARALANPAFMALRQETERRLAAASPKSSP